MFAALVALIVTGCTATPPRFRNPLATYTPPAPIRIRVVGFEYERFRPAAVAHASSFGGATESGTVSGWTGSGKWQADASWGSRAHAVAGEYVTETNAPDVAAAFANTGCFEVVGPSVSADFVFEGRASGYKAAGLGRRALSIVEAFTLTPLLGMPIWGKAEGQSSVNVYRYEDGTLVRSFHATVPVDYMTTIYSYGEDEPDAFGAARAYAIRDTIEQAAAAFCGGSRR